MIVLRLFLIAVYKSCLYDSTARRLNITNQKVTQLAAKGAGAGGGKAKK